MIKYVPNILTIARFFFIPFIVQALIEEEYVLAIILYSLSSLTDVIDGLIARKFNAISDIGKVLDPLADKSTQISVFLTLGLKGMVDIWIIAILLIKDLLMIIGGTFLYKKEYVVSSKWYGKATTVLIYVTVISSLLIKQFNWYRFDKYLYYVILVFAIYSFVKYTKFFVKDGYLEEKEVKRSYKN